MGAAGIEIPDWINESSVEEVFRRAQRARSARKQHFAEKGMRAARDRNSQLLKALEGGAEVLHRIQERQIGYKLRSQSTHYSEKVDLTEYSMWREAYKQCDKGEPLRAFEWVYGAAAELAGL